MESEKKTPGTFLFPGVCLFIKLLVLLLRCGY